jgi:hypothetical protein
MVNKVRTSILYGRTLMAVAPASDNRSSSGILKIISLKHDYFFRQKASSDNCLT